MYLVTAETDLPFEPFPIFVGLVPRFSLPGLILRPRLYHHDEAELLKCAQPKFFDQL